MSMTLSEKTTVVRNEEVSEQIRIGGSVVQSSPRVSVVIPAYNVADFVVETLESVFAQTFNDIEVIVVNDGSPDTPALEKSLAPFFDRLIYIVQKNAGPGAARNNAVSHARGEFVAFVDGDDLWLQDKLEKQINFLIENNLDMAYSNGELFGSSFVDGRLFMDNSPSSGPVSSESILSAKCNVLLSSSIIRRTTFDDAGGFDESVPGYDPNASGYEDFELWFRIARSSAQIGYLTEPLIRYRTREGNMTGGVAQMNMRTMVALDFIKDKHQLTTGEEQARKILYDRSKKNYFIELAKQDLIAGNFTEAQKNFEKANTDGSLKLKVLKISARYFPSILRTLFAKFRPAEFSFANPRSNRG